KFQAIGTYESGRKIGVLPRDLHRLGKALARGSGYKSIADAVIDSAALGKAVEDRLCSDVNIECKRLCSKANPTLLRTATKDSVLNFSWRAVGQEIREKSPLFYRLLLALADPKSLSKSSDPETTERYRCLAQKPQQRHELRSLCHQHHSQGREDFKTGPCQA
ncbi:unnamed protein product, partial [Porites lobata]